MTSTIPVQPTLAGRKALIGALVLGAIAAGLIVAFLSTRNSSSGSTSLATTVSVVTAKDDIAAGTVLKASLVEVRDIPKDLAISGGLPRLSDVEGKTVRHPIARGEQISNLHLVDTVKAQTLSVQIPVGLRGFTIPVDTTRSPAGLLAPGDFVDVIVSGELSRLGGSTAGTLDTLNSSGDKPHAAVTLLQNVQVLAVQRKFAANGTVYDSSTRGQPPGATDDVTFITLAVTPEQAQLLWLASEGKVTVSLRAFGDDKITTLAPIAEPIRFR